MSAPANPKTLAAITRMLTRCGTALAGLCMSASCLAQSLTLSPAVVPLLGSPGQSVTQTLLLRNDSDVALEFELEARDVVVRDGRRETVAAGEMSASIAASAVFSQPRLRVEPRTSATAQVTLTLPAAPSHRAAIVYFRGAQPVSVEGTRALLSIGTLFTFALSGNVSVSADALQVQPPSASTEMQADARVLNDGSEPVVPRGVVAVLDFQGRLMGKAVVEPHRLLPGEAGEFAARYPGDLAPGQYRALLTLDVEGRAVTREAAFVVQ